MTRSSQLAAALLKQRKRRTNYAGKKPYSEALQERSYNFACAEPPETQPAGCETLEAYLEQYAPALARQAQAACRPLHVPGGTPLAPVELLRPAYEAQSHVITAGIRALDRQRAIQIAAEMGTGKGGLPSTRVLTPSGWTTLGEIKVGDAIIDPEGGTTTVTGKFERGVMSMFRVTFCDGSSTVCSADHLWLVNSPLRKWKKRPGKVLRLEQIEKIGLTHSNGNRQHFIPLVKPVDFHATRIPTHPYLLGYLLGNACLTQKTIYVCAPDRESADRIASMLPSDASLKPASRGINYRISGGSGRSGNSLLTQLRKLKLMGCSSDRKFIPQAYLFSNRFSRVHLLQGLLDSDGCIAGDNGTGIEYSTASHRLASQVIELVQSLGGVATRAIKEAPAYTHKGEKRTGQPSHRLYIALPPDVAPFALSRKADAYKPRTKYFPTRSIASIGPYGEDECICIAVASENKLYVTDDYIVTHNTLISQAICQGHSHDRGYRAIVFCPPHLVHKWEREIKATLTNAHVHHLRTYHDVTRLLRDMPRVGRGWWIVSNTRAKMGPKWKPAFLPRRRSPYLRCPRCHGPLRRFDKKLNEWLPIEGDLLCTKKLRCANDIETPDGGLIPCDAPLWQWTHEIDRWPIASFIKEKLPGWFDYLVIDESHQTKSAETAVGQAMGSLAAACGKTICLTGTLFGGYAWHVRPLLYRIAPRTLIDEGLQWQDEMEFNSRYGRLERRVTTIEKHGGADNKQSKGTTTKTAKYVRPGVMPTLFGRHLIGSTIFLSLDEVAEALPQLEETVVGVPLDAELEAAYREVETAITEELKRMLQKRDKRLLSKMLHTLLGYPDHPYDWKEIGYYDTDEFGNQFWKHVTTPQSLDRRTIRPKEQALIDLVKQELAQGRKCWVYCVMTDARDVNERLRQLLADAGLRVAVLRASVETTEREAWIAAHATNLDCIISHPALVETGLDFFDANHTYNFVSIVGYSLGYTTFTMRQAMRRHWRIGQRETCRNFYLHYADTMQARALSLMGKKLVASTSIEGKFTSEGLAALAGDEGTLEVALAKSLVERLDDCQVGRAWGKLGQTITESAALITETPQLITNDEPAEFELPPPKHVFQHKQLAMW